MSDIHQEWRELREKNGNFINHLDGEVAKIEKEKNQMIFYDPRTCTYFKADRDEIQEQINKLMEELVSNTTSAKKMSDAYTQLLNEKADLQKKLDAVEKQANDISDLYGKACMEAHQAKVAKDRMGYSNRCMQSKIAKQANEIKRLTEENKQLHKALDIAAKDANANFERGKIKGMQEIWKELVDCYDGRPTGENNKIFGYYTVGDMLMNLSPTWFMNKAREYHKQEDKKAKDIQIGDEVEIFDQCDHSLSDTGIVAAIDFVIDENLLHFTVVGNNFGACFTEADIDAGNVKKTGRHYDAIPLDYFK